MTSDNRLSWDFVREVFDVVERHGYHRYDNQHTGQAIGLIADLAEVYEGAREIAYGTYLQPGTAAPSPGTTSVQHEADQDAVILNNTETALITVALNIASNHKRDQAQRCSYCADQSCPGCQYRLQDARIYHQLATQLDQTVHIAKIANHTQREPGTLPAPIHQPEAAADKEAGQ